MTGGINWLAVAASVGMTLVGIGCILWASVIAGSSGPGDRRANHAVIGWGLSGLACLFGALFIAWVAR